MKLREAVPRGWFTRSEMAGFFDVSEQQFDQLYRRQVPPGAERTINRRPYFHARSLHNALLESERGKAPQTAGPDADPLLAGGDSPNLERYRGAKADLAEMDLQERRGTHANLEELDGALMRFAGGIRRAGEVLQRRFGNEASDILNEGIDGAVAAYHAERERLNDGGGSGGDVPRGDGPGDSAGGRRGAGPKAAKPARVR